jgi:hypothetical protein
MKAYQIFILLAIAVGIYLIFKTIQNYNEKEKNDGNGGGNSGGSGLTNPTGGKNWWEMTSYRPPIVPVAASPQITRTMRLDPTSSYYSGAAYVNANYTGGYNKWVRDNWNKFPEIGVTGNDDVYKDSCRLQFYGKFHFEGNKPTRWWYYKTPMANKVKMTPDGFVFTRHNALHRAEARCSGNNITIFSTGMDILLRAVTQNTWEVII